MSISLENRELADGVTIAVLTLGDDENRLSPDRLDSLENTLAAVRDDAAGLVTVGGGKFYSNGLDQEWMLANLDRLDEYVERVQRVFETLLTFPNPTAAALNGHAFGAGAMLALAHDHRLMRADRGYFCFPEVDINIPFTTGMAALIQSKLIPASAHESMTTGRRYGGPEALAAGIVESTAAQDDLLAATAASLTGTTGKDPRTLHTIKSTMYASVVTALRAGRGQ